MTSIVRGRVSILAATGALRGKISTPSGVARINEKYNPERPILEDFICVLDSQGEELQRLSVVEALENSAFAPALKKSPPFGDILHTNTIELIATLFDVVRLEKDFPLDWLRQ